VKRAVPEAHQAFHDVFIRMKGEVEVRQRFLKFEEAEEFLVLQRFADLGLDDVGLFVDLLQVEQEGRRCLGEDLEEETCLLVGPEGCEGVPEEFLHDEVLLEAHRDEVILRDEDAERQCVVGIRLKDDWRIHDDEDVIVFELDVGTFFTVEGGLQGIDRDPGQFIQMREFFLAGGGAIDPRALIELLQ